MAEKNTAVPKVMLEGFGANEFAELGRVTQDMTTSYFAKPKEEALADWLGTEEIPAGQSHCKHGGGHSGRSG